MRGKYIVKRLIFFGVTLAVGLLAVLLLQQIIPGGGRPRPLFDVLRRSGTTLLLIVVPLVISFVIAMLTGLAKSNGAKNVFRVISAVLRALVPFAFGLVLLNIFAIKLGLFPAAGFMGGASLVLPLLALTLPLTGFLMNAAAYNGHKQNFAGSVGAVAAWAADKIPAIVIAELVSEQIFSISGLGMMTIQSISMWDSQTMAITLIVLVFIVYLLRFLFDVIAAAASGGDPSEQVYGKRESGDRSGRVLLLVGIICAALMIVFAIVLPFLSSGNPAAMNPGFELFAPGEGGYLLGTDMYGRDLFTMIALGLRNTLLYMFTNTLVACILGVGFGILAGIIRGTASEIFRGLRYLFGHGAPFAFILIILLSRSSFASLFVVGLFGWGGIADRIDNGIRAKRNNAPGRTSIILPALEQLAHTACFMIIYTTAVSVIGLTPMNPSFPTLGYLISMGRSYLTAGDHIVLWPVIVLVVCLVAFFLLHAGLCARERRLFSEK